MRTNRQIRAPKVRLIDKNGDQVGVVTTREAQMAADEAGLDLVEISPNAHPPVCKIIDYGKYKYQLTKKEKESKKAQHQAKLKEIKTRPNIDEHDLQFKLRHAREFLEKGNKVRFTCMYRGREMARPEVGMKIAERFIEELKDIASVEAKPKLMGRNLTMVLAPQGKK